MLTMLSISRFANVPAVERMREYLAATAPVGEHLADQLLIAFALVGRGSFTAVKASLHTTTNIDVIRRSLDVLTGNAQGWRESSLFHPFHASAENTAKSR